MKVILVWLWGPQIGVNIVSMNSFCAEKQTGKLKILKLFRLKQLN